MNTLDERFNQLPLLELPAGQVVLHQGQRCEHYVILQQGQVKVIARAANGRELLLYHITPGEICVLTTSCLLGEDRFPAEAISETPLVLRLLPKAQFDRLIDSDAAFRQHVFQSLGSRISGLISTIEKVALESIEQRLARYLLLQPEQTVTITHQTLASEIGSAREVVSRQLKRFELNGWIQLGRGTITLLDRQRLYHLL